MEFMQWPWDRNPAEHKVRYLDHLSTLRVSVFQYRDSIPFSLSLSFSLTFFLAAMKSRQRSEIEILLYGWPAENGRRGFIR